MDTIHIDRKGALMVAHRGVSGLEKENTASAFVAAGNRSYFGIETDVHRTLDGEFVVIHDDNTARVAIDNLEVEKSTFETLRALRLCDTDGEKGRADLRIPTLREYVRICRKYGILTVLDASLLQDNLYFIKTREEAMKDKSVREITRMVADLFDIIYFSARKFGFARGGALLVRSKELFRSMEDLIPMFEGFLTYGGMSVKEMEAMTVGFEESMDLDVISQGPQFIDYCVRQLDEYGVPVITPGGGLGAHLDARQILAHVPQEEYPAGALVCALYICGGIRGMERGTLSEEREPDGTERIASMELLRLAFPRRVFTLSQTEYVIDRVKWLFDHRELVGGLRFVHEPATLRFFTGVLEPIGDWPEKLAAAYRADFGDEQ